MRIKDITVVTFSPVGKTKEVALGVAQAMAEALRSEGSEALPIETVDFTLPGCRGKHHTFGPQTLVVFATPTYAGRVPNKALPFVQEFFSAEGSPTVALVTFGNRNFDSSLTELSEELKQRGFRVFAAAAVACRHVFSETLAAGRPDEKDWEAITDFAARAAGSLQAAAGSDALAAPVIRDGAPVGPYYTPLGLDNEPAVFLKAKPVTDRDRCIDCGICVERCPMGSINPEDVTDTPGICIKCHACIRHCPTGAKSFADPAFLSHVAMLEQNYMRRAEPEFYLCGDAKARGES